MTWVHSGETIFETVSFLDLFGILKPIDQCTVNPQNDPATIRNWMFRQYKGNTLSLKHPKNAGYTVFESHLGSWPWPCRVVRVHHPVSEGLDNWVDDIAQELASFSSASLTSRAVHVAPRLVPHRWPLSLAKNGRERQPLAVPMVSECPGDHV